MRDAIFAGVGGLLLGALIIGAMLFSVWRQRYPKWKSLLRGYSFEGCTVNYRYDGVELVGVIAELALIDGMLTLAITDAYPTDPNTSRLSWSDELRITTYSKIFRPILDNGRLKIEAPQLNALFFIRLPTTTS